MAMTPQQMAEDLAEYQYLHSTPTELLNLAKQAMREYWLDQSYRDTDYIQSAYNDMTGETKT